MGDYSRGFEDAMEIALAILNESKDLEEAKEKLKVYLGQTMGKKFERVRRELGVPDSLGP